MFRVFITLFLVAILPYQLSSQIFPKEESQLNYRLIGFSFPGIKSGKCTLEIALGHYNSRDSFNKNIIEAINCDTSRKIAEVPAFGKDYTWCIVKQGKRSGKSELHHFSTMMSKNVDTSITRLRIINSAQQHKDAYVFVDCSHALYDMKGNPVWFVPDSSNSDSKDAFVHSADIKLSPQGTITFLAGNNVYEINYNGDILWKGPNDGKDTENISVHYHHEFTRLANGHYMVMGNDTALWKLPDYKKDSTPDEMVVISNDSSFYQKIPYGTLIEYDEKGSVVWSWKSVDYLKKSDLYKQKTEKGMFHILDAHENSFFFDEKTSTIYVSCKNISRIIKLKYPEGTILAVYGNTYSDGIRDMGNDLFSGQHSVRISQDGYLYLFNNNVSEADFPKIIMMQEPADKKGDLKKIWEYACTPEGMSDREQGYYIITKKSKQKDPLRVHFTTGGNVIELNDRSIFACMNGPSSKIFIVTKDKDVVWSAIPEVVQPNESVWSPFPAYRASIITNRKDLERLIWNAEAKDK